MIDVGKCWLSNYDNRTEESAEKSKLTSAFPEFVSHLLRQVWSIAVKCPEFTDRAVFNTLFMKVCEILTFCLDLRKKRYSLILKFGWLLGNWKRVSYWEMSGNHSSSITYYILKRKTHCAPASVDVALQVLQPAEGRETFHQERRGGSQNIACQIWPCVGHSSDSEIIGGSITLPP